MRSRKIALKVAKVFEPLLAPARYKGAHGGRGSGKSWFFGEQAVVECLRQPATSIIAVRETQRTLRESSKRLIEARIQQLGVGSAFQVLHDRIRTPGDGLIAFQGMSDATAESVKSLEGFRIAWVEEAQSLSERSLSLLRPTIRAPESEIWFSWNATREHDAVDRFLRKEKPAGAIVVQSNWADNPWWSQTLEQERLTELELYPDRYGHTYEGEYASAFEGAYFSIGLLQARAGGRIGEVEADPIVPLRAFIDIGGAGARADAFALWIVQWVGQTIRVLDYYESVGQTLGEHAAWLRSKGYENVLVHLPHDGINVNNLTGKRYVDHFREAGFNCAPQLANQGAGAASMRIEAVRRLLPKCWFNADTTEAGLSALGFYHERRDSQRKIGLGPEHDWSSHAADAFGLMAIAYEEPSRSANFNRPLAYRKISVA